MQSPTKTVIKSMNYNLRKDTRNMKIKIMLDEGAYMPEYAHLGADAGADIRTPVPASIAPHSAVIIDTGVHIEIPEGYVGMLKSKSGLNVNQSILTEGVDSEYGFDNYPVDPETAGHFTGLTDRNGTKIFEGDILLIIHESNIGRDEWKAKVVFGNPKGEYGWGWNLVPITPCCYRTDILLWVGVEETGAFCEVIGNIYDNPELLEVSE